MGAMGVAKDQVHCFIQIQHEMEQQEDAGILGTLLEEDIDDKDFADSIGIANNEDKPKSINAEDNELIIANCDYAIEWGKKGGKSLLLVVTLSHLLVLLLMEVVVVHPSFFLLVPLLLQGVFLAFLLLVLLPPILLLVL